MYNTYDSQNLYVDFPKTVEAPPGEPAGSKALNWMRATASEQVEACPIKFEAVSSQTDVYYLYSMYADSEFQHYLGSDATDDGYISASKAFSPKAGAMKVKLIINKALDGTTGNKKNEYIMQDFDTGRYVSYCDGGCSGGKWLSADYNKTSDAMVVELLPSGASPQPHC